MLSENAGAVIALLHMYTVTKDAVYLQYAEHAADLLMTHRVASQEFAAWKVNGTELPLAGMAHGSSGFLMAFVRLAAITHVGKYWSMSLYVQEVNNWK